MTTSTVLFVVTSVFLLLWQLPSVDSHGMMLFPNQRGALSPKAPYFLNVVPGAENTTVDYYMHFPSGNKTNSPGSGHLSQIAEVAKTKGGWQAYDPYNPSFRLRAGLCGDMVGQNEHMRYGDYYNGGYIAAEFWQGGVIAVNMGVTAHHNGFVELHVCDVAKCGGEISRRCFLDGFCVPLERAGNDRCEDRDQPDCAPKDPNFPSRWYLPCETKGTRISDEKPFVLYGENNAMRYRLPENLTCEHCVLQWFWTSANNCNPPGVREFFNSTRAPRKWGQCEGQAGAKGGFVDREAPCHGFDEKIPEEYYQCSDIRIKPKILPNKRGANAPASQSPRPSAPPARISPPWKTKQPNRTGPSRPSKSPKLSPSSSTAPKRGNGNGNGNGNREYVPNGRAFGAVRDIVLVRNGRRIQSLVTNTVVKYYPNARYSVEAVTVDSVRTVRFDVRIRKKPRFIRSRSRSGSSDIDPSKLKPFYLFGTTDNDKPRAWLNVPVDKQVLLTVTAKGRGRKDVDKVLFKFVR